MCEKGKIQSKRWGNTMSFNAIEMSFPYKFIKKLED